jgi:aryl-alcohol dehydrogenase-like predicted oxidoreductase
MDTRSIGSLSVPSVGLGCNNFGGRLDYDATLRVLDAALDAGVVFLDTADIYGGTRSEEFMGRALEGRRDRMVLATKFGMRIDDAHQGGRPEYARKACDDSLKRLRTDHIDLYQYHRPDPNVPIAETLGAMNELVKAGKVREIGCSNFTVEQLQEAERAVPAGGARFVSVQNEYSLLHREPEDGVLAECARQGIAFIPYFPLASGLLTGKYHAGQPAPAGTRLADGPRAVQLTHDALEIVEKLRAFARAHDHTLLELAISWLAHQPTVASVIAGATKPEQVRGNAAAADWKLKPAELEELDRIVPRGFVRS